MHMAIADYATVDFRCLIRLMLYVSPLCLSGLAATSAAGARALAPHTEAGLSGLELHS